MANRYAVATGNWSNTAIWDGGTLPVAGDVVRSNNFTITVDQNINVLSIRNDALAPAVAGGGFQVIATGRTLTCDIYAGNNDCLTISGFTGSTAITGNSYATGSNGSAVLVNGANITLNYIGDAFSGYVNSGISTTSNSGIRVSAGNFNFTGNAWSRGGGYACGVYSAATNCSNTFTGNAYNNSATAHAAGAGLLVSGTNNVTVFNGTAEHIVNQSTVINAAAVFVGTGATLSGLVTAIGAINGVGSGITASTTLPATAIIKKSINRSGVGALLNVKYTTSSPIVDVILSNNSTISLTDPSTTNPPVPADVRFGTIYSGGAYTGTLKVPPVTSVSYGVPTDNTVGTAFLSATDLFTAIATSSDPVAERLRNVSTVQITGDQLQAAFNT